MDILTNTSTESIIKCFYKVYNTLGYGFLEKVYEKALMVELEKQGIPCVSQAPIKVYYEGDLVGNYFADILINSEIILELKAADIIVQEHELQLINYLKATTIEVGYLLNFGPKPQFVRKVFSNNRKKS
jgi:GxxExxY protein